MKLIYVSPPQKHT